MDRPHDFPTTVVPIAGSFGEILAWLFFYRAADQTGRDVFLAEQEKDNRRDRCHDRGCHDAVPVGAMRADEIVDAERDRDDFLTRTQGKREDEIRPGEQEAEQLVSFVKTEVKSEVDNKREILATKSDIFNMQKTIYVVGLIQFLAVIGSVIGIVNFMIK